MSSVLLLQCLCPARHCILAFGGEAPPLTRETLTIEAHAAVEAAIAAGRMNPWCELCKAKRDQWSFEIAELENRRLADVLPEMKRQEAEQLRKQAAFKAQERAARN